MAALSLLLSLILLKAVAGEDNILVIGGAGFLGYHTMLQLIENGAKVLVLENFNNPLDDAQTQKLRAGNLQKKGVEIHEGDACDVPLMKHFIEVLHVNKVLYLAGEVHTDIPMDKIGSYVEENLQCFIAVLEVLRDFKNVLLIYGSSPLVLNKDMSVFKAIKTSEDSFSDAYCQEYGVKSVGVRPFYVYGPWSRPNTFVHDIAAGIWDGKEIEVYQTNDGQSLLYDTTFVTDVANGIQRLLMKGMPSKCGTVYNLANNEQRTSIDTIVEQLEAKLGKKAKKKIVKVSVTPPITDIYDAKSDLGFLPKVTFDKGIDQFVEWFKGDSRKSKDKIVIDTELRKQVKKEFLKKKGEGFVKRMQEAREKYEVFAKKNNLPVARFYKNKTFKFFPNRDSGRDERTVKRSVEELKKMCADIDECVAFNTNGGLKSMIDPEPKWKHTSSGGLYVAEIDICQAGLHNCYGSSTCKSLGPAQFECGCAKGSVMVKQNPPTCTQKEYVQGIPAEEKAKQMFNDRLHGDFWSGTPNDDFTEHKGEDLSGHLLLSYPEAKGDVKMLEKACLDTYHCDGFSTKSSNLFRFVKLVKDSSSTAYTRNHKTTN